MKFLKLCLVLVSILVTTSCTSIKVVHDYDTKADFSSLRTFDWIPVSAEEGISSLNVRRVKDAINTRLIAKGFVMASGRPDFLVAMHVVRKQKIRVTDWGYHYGPYRPYRQTHLGMGRMDVDQYEEGTLIIDMVDSRSKELIWRGTATSTLESGRTPEEQEKKINEAVEKILSNFPPVTGN